MNNEKRKISVLARLVSNVAFKTAIESANTACPMIHHQEKLPKKVVNLRKF